MHEAVWGVVVCPYCEMARAVNISQKTTTCSRCETTFELRKREIMYKTSDARKVGAAVAELNRQLMQQ